MSPALQRQPKGLLPGRDRLSAGSPLQAGHSPCRVRKSRPESMPVGARGGGDAARLSERAAWGGSAGRCGHRLSRGGRRPGVGPRRRTAPRARQPALLPAPSGGPRKDAERGGGPGKPGQPWPGLRPAGCARARNSQIPPASSAAATHGPCHYGELPAPRPGCGRLATLRVWVMWGRIRIGSWRGQESLLKRQSSRAVRVACVRRPTLRGLGRDI